MPSIEEIARALGNGSEHKTGDGWVTSCPAHNDDKASLSLRAPHGKTLVRCHAGCTQEEVIEALTERGLWEKKSTSLQSWKPIRPVPKGTEEKSHFSHNKHGTPTRFWEYRELDGNIVGYVCRFESKNAKGEVEKVVIPTSFCYSDKGGKAWQWKAFDKPRPFYNLPLFKKLKDKPIIIFEGEKAADAAQKIFKEEYVCTAWPGGAAASKFADTKYLKGRKVILWADNDEPGFKAMNTLADIMIAEIGNTPDMVPIPHGLPKGWDIADDLPEDFSMDYRMLVSKASQYVSISESDIAEINKEFALVITGGKPTVLFEKDQPDGSVDIEYWTVDAFKHYYGNQNVVVGKTSTKMGDYWLTHPDRRTYRGLVFEPGQEKSKEYNLWQGFSYEPEEGGDWSIFEEHLRNNVCGGDESLFNWVFGWFANIVQNPATKSGTSLSLRGQQGSGKTVVGVHFGRLIKRHYTLIDQERYLFGNFNSHLASTLLLHSDEGFWGGDPRNVGKLKSIVTSETHLIEHKGKDSLKVNNYVRLLITTNEDWVVPAAFEERRFAILDVNNGNQQDETFFEEMEKQLKSGGYSGLLNDLLKFDLKSIRGSKIPVTSALEQQKEVSMSQIDQYWFTCLLEGNSLLSQKQGWLHVVKTADLHEDYLDFTNRLGYRRAVHLNSFFRTLRKFIPDGYFERKIIGPTKQSAITIPPLAEAREYFNKMTGINHDWDVVDATGEEYKNMYDQHKRGSDGEIPF